MKQVTALALTIALCFTLAACSNRESTPENTAQEIQAEYEKAQSITMLLALTADYGDRVYEYKLKYTGSMDSGDLEVLEPESIAGMTIQISPEGTALSYEGVMLDTGAIAEDGLSPVDAVPLMLASWREGYFSECRNETLFETDTVSAAVEISDTVSLKTWFDKKSSLPLYAEISSSGYAVISCKFENVIIE